MAALFTCVSLAAFMPLRSPAFASCARSHGVSMGNWVDEQHEQGGVRYCPEVSVEDAAAMAELMKGPSPQIEAGKVVKMVCDALKRGSNEDIEAMWNFIEPEGGLASQYRSAAGSMKAFRWKVRKEQRWKNIAARPHAAMVHMRGYELIGGLMTDVDVRQYLVRCSPFFPDAPFAESVVTFKVDVVRQFVDAKRHKEQAEALGNRANCWIIDNITPGFGEWEVKDPISADRCPDFFKPPKRSAED